VRPEGLSKFKDSHHRVSNTRPSGLQHNALTTTLQCIIPLLNMPTHWCGKKSDTFFSGKPKYFHQIFGCRLHLQGWSTIKLCYFICSGLLHRLLLNSEDEGEMFLRNAVWVSTEYTIYLRRVEIFTTTAMRTISSLSSLLAWPSSQLLDSLSFLGFGNKSLFWVRSSTLRQPSVTSAGSIILCQGFLP
jgi:hypothetical protein